jgi:hypothetical protein
LRIIAALSGEENMIKAFLNNEDIHKSTASKVFDVPLKKSLENNVVMQNSKLWNNIWSFSFWTF